MLKFEKMLLKGMPKNINNHGNIPDEYSIRREWQSFYDECQLYMEKTKNRKPIVNFKIDADKIWRK